MTFEQFQATKKAVPDLNAVLPDEDHVPGLVYADVLHIWTVAPHWKGTECDGFQYHLLIERDEWVSNDLTELERTLYEWAGRAGYWDQEPCHGPEDTTCAVCGLGAERCTYPKCRCIVSTSSSQPEPICPKALPKEGA